MGLNFQQVFEKIHEIGLGARAHQESLNGLREHASHLMDDWAGKLDELRDKVERARQHDPSLRCAIPVEERLDTSLDPGPVSESPVTLLAADGSQIAPDRHAALQYSLVNVGAVALEPGSGQPPETFTDSRLLFADELYTETSILTEEAISQQRDIAERKKLLELAPNYSEPVVALTDGPVELWGAKGAGEEDYRRNVEIHKSVLSQLQGRGVIVAGYVDKPGADLVVRLLELVEIERTSKLENVRKEHPLRGVTDRWLYGQNGLLKPGHRSALFALQSGSRAHYAGDLAIHFCYLNVGDDRHPALVRVEMPRWVAEDSAKLNLLHAVLLAQCRVMGARPYPYILHRAHEVAVVKFEEKKQIEQMLELELRRAGGELDEKSSKQSAKDLPGRGRK